MLLHGIILSWEEEEGSLAMFMPEDWTWIRGKIGMLSQIGEGHGQGGIQEIMNCATDQHS